MKTSDEKFSGDELYIIFSLREKIIKKWTPF